MAALWWWDNGWFFSFFYNEKFIPSLSGCVCPSGESWALASGRLRGHFLAGDPQPGIWPPSASVFSSVQWGQKTPPDTSEEPVTPGAQWARGECQPPRITPPRPRHLPGLRRKLETPPRARRRRGAGAGSPGRAPAHPPASPRRAALPPYPGGRRAGIGPAGEPGQRGRAPERGARARAGRAGARAARSGPCAPRPPRPRLQRGPRAPRPARGQALRSAAPGGGRAWRALERRPGGEGSRRARAAPLRWPGC